MRPTMTPHAARLPLPFSRLTCAVLLLAIIGLWLANIGHRVLQHPDEGRYAEIAREMAVTGDWVTPRLDGLKYFEKPPLQYWITAATFRVFGAHEWTARLWPVIAGMVAALAIAWAGVRLGGPLLGLAAGLALAGTLWQVALSQILTLDAMLSALLAVGFAAFVVAQRAEATFASRRAAMWLTWAAMAGATLTKGLIGVVIPGAVLVLYALINRDFKVWRRLHLASGIGLYLFLTAPWFVLVGAANPEFFDFFFIHEHFQRFLTNTHRRNGSLLYFVPLLAAGLLPWLTLLLFGVRRAWQEGVPNALGFSWQRFALVWAAFVFVFFSVSGSKLPSYILPMFPPLALIAGWLLVQIPTRRLAQLTLPLTVAATALALGMLVAYPQAAAHLADDRQPMSTLLAFRPWLTLAVFAAAGGGALAVLLFRSSTERSRFAAITALSLSTLIATQLIVAGLDSFRTTRSSYDILGQAAAQLADPSMLSSHEIPFFQVRMYDQTAPFYLKRTMTLVDFKDELSLGIDAQPELAINDSGDWTRRWTGLVRGFALLSPADFEQFQKAGVPMRELARDTRRVIVSRQ